MTDKNTNMKFRLKKLYQTLSKTIQAGTIKTVEEWTRIMPELWGSDLTKNFPDWFEKVSTLVLVTRGENDGSHVCPSTVDKFRYDGKRLTGLSISANVNSYEDVKELIQFLEVTKCCFQHTSYNEPPRQSPLTPDECVTPKVDDYFGKKCSMTETVFYKTHESDNIYEASTCACIRDCRIFFKFKTDLKLHYGLR